MNISDLNAQGLVFTAMNQAGATVTLINTSTATGFILSNPWGSGKKLVLWQVDFNYTTVPAAAALIFGAISVAPSPIAMATGTALDVVGADGTGVTNRSVARAYNAVTTPNLPRYAFTLGYSPTTPATASGLTVRAALNGAYILVPGSYMQISYITTAPVGIGSALWAELPL
jgi:hypothetical protein